MARSRADRKKADLMVGLLVVGGLVAVLVVGACGFAGWFFYHRAQRGGHPDTVSFPVGDGVEIIRPVKKQPNEVTWNRLTPANHPVTLQVPGKPTAMDRNFFLFEFGPHDGAPAGWEAEGPNRNRYFLIQTQFTPVGPQGLPEEGLGGKQSIVGLGGMYCGLAAPPALMGTVTIDGVTFEHYENPRQLDFAGKSAFRVGYVGTTAYIYGVTGPTGRGDVDPLVPHFLATFKLARTKDGKPARAEPTAPSGIPGLAVHLSFDNAPLGLDSVSRQSIGTPVGAVGQAPGVRGQALDLSNGSQFRLRLPGSASARGGRPVTVAFWFRTNQPDGTLFVATTAPEQWPNRRYPFLELGLLPTYPFPNPGQPQSQAITVHRWTRMEAVEYVPVRVTGDWVHLTYVRDASGQILVYMNAIRLLGAGGEWKGDLGGPDAILGGLWPGGFTGEFDPEAIKQANRGRQPFRGLIDEFVIYNTALTDDQIRKLAGR